MASTPNSSRTIMIVTIIIGIVLTLVIWPLSMIGKGSSSGSSDEAELRIQPIAHVEKQKVVVQSDGKPRTGEMVYNTVCKACHEAGVAGAPKTGDKAAWGPRIATGLAALLKSASDGKNAMPPKGGAADLTDAELKAAVEYLTGKAK